MAEITDPTLLDALNGSQKKSGEITDPDLLAHLNGTTAPRPTPRFVNPRGGAYNPNDYTAPAPGAVLRAAGQGATMGWMDEGEAALRSLIGGQTYDEEKAKIDQRTAEDKKALGAGYTAMELAGGAAVPGAGMIKAAEKIAPVGASIARKAAANYVVPAAAGAVQSYGSQEGDKSVGKALEDGAIAGAIPLALNPVLSGAWKLTRGAANYVGDRAATLNEGKEAARWARGESSGPMPVTQSAQKGAVKEIVDELQSNGIGADDFRNMGRDARLPNENSVAPVVAAPVLRGIGNKSAGSLNSSTYGGAGDIAGTFEAQSLRDANGVRQSDNLNSRILAKENLPPDSATRLGEFEQARAISNARIDQIANSGGATHMPEFSQMVENFPDFQRQYLKAMRTRGERVLRDEAGRIVIPGDRVDLGVVNLMHREFSAMRQAGMTPSQQDMGRTAMEYFDDIRPAAGRGYQDLRAAYDNAAGSRTASERMAQGEQFGTRTLSARDAAHVERANLTPQEQTEQAAGTLYKLSSDIDNASASGVSSGRKLNGVADTYFGTPSKVSDFTEWSRRGGQAGDHAFTRSVEEDLRKLGARHETADELRRLLNNGQSQAEFDGLKSAADVVRPAAYSSRVGAVAAIVQKIATGTSKMRKYQVARLLYDKTAAGEQAIYQEFLRRANARRLGQSVDLTRNAILHNLALQAAGYMAN